MNIRSINNKHDEFSQFLDKQTNNTFVVVTETWINEKQDIPENFLSNKHIFLQQPRSNLTKLTRGGGVGI